MDYTQWQTPKSQGRLIVIEGVDGTGKSTLIENIKQKVEEKQKDNFLFLREPGDTPIGRFAREWVHSVDATKDANMATQALFLFSASRLEMINNIIKPALAEGKTIITDRFALSTAVYQDLDIDWEMSHIVKAVLLELAKTIQVDQTIYLHCPAHVLVERLNQRGEAGGIQDAADSKDIEFYRSVLLKYAIALNTYSMMPPKLLGQVNQVDATQTPDQIACEVLDLIGFTQVC